MNMRVIEVTDFKFEVRFDHWDNLESNIGKIPLQVMRGSPLVSTCTCNKYFPSKLAEVVILLYPTLQSTRRTMRAIFCAAVAAALAVLYIPTASSLSCQPCTLSVCESPKCCESGSFVKVSSDQWLFKTPTPIKNETWKIFHVYRVSKLTVSLKMESLSVWLCGLFREKESERLHWPDVCQDLRHQGSRFRFDLFAIALTADSPLSGTSCW